MYKADLIDIDRQMFQMRCKAADWDGSLLEEANVIASRSPRSFTVEYADKVNEVGRNFSILSFFCPLAFNVKKTEILSKVLFANSF